MWWHCLAILYFMSATGLFWVEWSGNGVEVKGMDEVVAKSTFYKHYIGKFGRQPSSPLQVMY